MKRIGLLVAFAAVVSAHSAAGQTISVFTEADSASQHSLYARNNAPFPVRFPSIELYQCRNIADAVCRAHQLGAVPAGQTAKVLTFGPLDPASPWGYQFRYDWEPATDLMSKE